MTRAVDGMFTPVWLHERRRLVGLIAGLVALGAVGVGAYLLGKSMSDDDAQSPAPAPAAIVHDRHPAAVGDLGFPAFATKNTTRVAGVDPIADAAGVALAVFPSTGNVNGPDAVTLVDSSDWATGIAAASLVAHAGRCADPAHRRRLDPGADGDRARGARAGGVGDHGRTPGLSRSGPLLRHLACAPNE